MLQLNNRAQWLSAIMRNVYVQLQFCTATFRVQFTRIVDPCQLVFYCKVYCYAWHLNSGLSGEQNVVGFKFHPGQLILSRLEN
jgi:hypothetical protein